MEMQSTKDYLLEIRNRVGKQTTIIVPNTEAYRILLIELDDKHTYLKGN